MGAVIIIKRFSTMPRKIFLGFIAALLLSGELFAQESCTAGDKLDRPRIGLVLGGGGARGLSHIGVIKVLEELRVPIDYVAGTSMGSIVGGFYATGMTATELEEVVGTIDWKAIFNDSTDRAERTYRRKRDDDLNLYGPKLGIGDESSLLPSGAISGQKITLLFQQQVSQRVQTKHFDQLPIPYRAVAADIIDGQPVVIEEDDLALAMRSSMSIPGLLSPVHYRDHILVDGGIAKNLPVDVVRDMGADIIIAVDVGSPLSTPGELGDMLAITGQLSNLLVQRNTVVQRALLTRRDVLIVPALGNRISSSQFEKGQEAIQIGLDAGDAVRAQLAPLGIPAEAYARYRRGITTCAPGQPTIQFVELDNRSRFSDAVIEKRLHVALGEPFDPAQLDKDMAEIYALGFIERSNYQVIEEDGRQGVLVRIDQDDRGTRFLETGFGFTSSDASNNFELRLALLNTAIDELGTEARVGLQLGDNYGIFGELYKPFGEKLNYILLPRIQARRDLFNLYDDGDNLAQVEAKRFAAELLIGREIDQAGAIFAGIRRSTGDLSVEIGTPDLVDESFEGGDWLLSGTWDRLDNRFFPSDGEFARVQQIFSRKAIGADTNFEQFESKLWLSRTYGDKHNFMGGLRYQTTFNGRAPIQNLYRGGGFFSMSGYAPNELTGQHFGFGLLGYRYRLADIPLLPTYVGGTVEFGNAVEDRDDILDDGLWNGSIYVGTPTIIGPIYLGWGWNEEESDIIFVLIGQLF
jgi:NTE family protein